MRNFWELFPEALPGPYCDALVERARQLPAVDAAVNYKEGLYDQPEIRRSTIRWFDKDGEDRNLANDIMFLARRANRNSFGFDITEPVAIQFAEYHGSNQGNFIWHQDVEWHDPAPVDRKLTFIAQLSDPTDYEGGDFEMLDQPSLGLDVKRRGAVIIFPSFWYHRVTPVTAGVRYSLVSWIEGPKFR